MLPILVVECFFLADPGSDYFFWRGGTSAPNLFGWAWLGPKGPTSPPPQNFRKWIPQNGEFFRNMYLRLPRFIGLPYFMVHERVPIYLCNIIIPQIPSKERSHIPPKQWAFWRWWFSELPFRWDMWVPWRVYPRQLGGEWSSHHEPWLQVAPLDPLLSDQLSSMGQEVPNKIKKVWEVFFSFLLWCLWFLWCLFVCLFVGWLVAWLVCLDW